VQCGYVLGTPLKTQTEDVSISTYTGMETSQRNLYVCATGMRASIKTVTFSYNGTGGQFSNLQVQKVEDKIYPDEQSKPLWAAEHSYDKAMRFDPLWGIVSDAYEHYGYKEGFYTMRAEKLWLPVSPFLSLNFGENEGPDSLAAASGFSRRLGNLYDTSLAGLDGIDYSGQNDYTMVERYQGISHNQTVVASIPSLIMTDGMAAALVGTKTSISQKYVQWPASLAVDDTSRGVPLARVTVYKRILRYDLRYAIPAFIILAALLLALLWAGWILASTRSIVRTLKNVYNQTSTGRLATNLLHPGQQDPTQSTRAWVGGDGKTLLSFGYIAVAEKDHFCKVVAETPSESKTASGLNGDPPTPPTPGEINETSIMITTK
jgi:hypothetical protein